MTLLKDRSSLYGRLVFYENPRREEWVTGWMGPKVNGPFLWRLFVGPWAIAWLRTDWDRPIVLPRPARRALQRGKQIHVAGYEHRRRKGARG